MSEQIHSPEHIFRTKMDLKSLGRTQPVFKSVMKLKYRKMFPLVQIENVSTSFPLVINDIKKGYLPLTILIIVTLILILTLVHLCSELRALWRVLLPETSARDSIWTT